jgi:hypothetical protein
LCAVGHAVVADHAGDTQAIIPENVAAPFMLRRAMCFQIAPRRHRLFVAPERKREDFSLLAQAFEPLDGEEAIDAVQQRMPLFDRITDLKWAARERKSRTVVFSKSGEANFRRVFS